MKTIIIIVVSLMSLVLSSCENPSNTVSSKSTSQTLLEQAKIYSESNNLEKNELDYEKIYCYELKFKETNLQEDIQEINVFLYNDMLLVFDIQMNPYPGHPMVRSGMTFDFRIRPQEYLDIDNYISAFESDDFSLKMQAETIVFLQDFNDSQGKSATSGVDTRFKTKYQLKKNIESFWQELLMRNDLPDISTNSGVREFIDLLLDEIENNKHLYQNPERI